MEPSCKYTSIYMYTLVLTWSLQNYPRVLEFYLNYLNNMPRTVPAEESLKRDTEEGEDECACMVGVRVHVMSACVRVREREKTEGAKLKI